MSDCIHQNLTIQPGISMHHFMNIMYGPPNLFLCIICNLEQLFETISKRLDPLGVKSIQGNIVDGYESLDILDIRQMTTCQFFSP